MHDLRIGGFTPFTTLDFPGRLAAVVFCQGCPWRCDYCHNQPLQPGKGRTAGPAWERVKAMLTQRRGLLDGVVFSGGEPCAQSGLRPALAAVKAMGYATGLHTAGAYPTRLEAALDTLDWIALDAKGPLEDYATIVHAHGAGERFRRSLEIVLGSGLGYEVRTTLYADATPEKLTRFAGLLAGLGVRHYAWQARRSADTAGRPLIEAPPDPGWHQAAATVGPWFESFEFRTGGP